MALGKKTHASITAPLKKMVQNLKVHVEEQRKQITALQLQQKEIQRAIDTSNNEIEKSNHTTAKINDLLGEVSK